MSEKMTDEQLVEQLLTPEPTEEPEEVETEEESEPETPEEESEIDEAEEAEEEGDEPDAEAEEESEDEENDEDPEEVEETGELHTVKVDGEEKQVDLDELKRGYSGQEYIRKGMQEVAEQRRSLEAADNQLRQHAQAMQQERQALLQLAQKANAEGLMPKPQEPSEELFHSDPIGYMEADLAYKKQLKSYNEQQQQLQWHQQQQVQQQQEQHKRLLEQNKNLLLEMVPEFRDATKAAELRDRLVKVAREYGYSEEEINSNVDARRVKELYDLAEYRRLKTGKEAAKKERKPIKTIKKSTGDRTAGKKLQRQKQLQKAKRTQSTEDFVALLFDN